MNIAKRLDEIGREEGGVHDVEVLESEPGQQAETTRLGKPTAMETVRDYVGGALLLASGVVSWLSPGRKSYGTNDLDTE